MKKKLENLCFVDSNDLISKENHLLNKLKNSFMKSGLIYEGSFMEGDFVYFYPDAKRTSILSVKPTGELYDSNPKIKLSLYGFSDFVNNRSICNFPESVGLNCILNQSEDGFAFFSDLQMERIIPKSSLNQVSRYRHLDVDLNEFCISSNVKGFDEHFFLDDLNQIFNLYFPKTRNFVTSIDDLDSFFEHHDMGILRGFSDKKRLELEFWRRNHMDEINNSNGDLTLLRKNLQKQYLYRRK